MAVVDAETSCAAQSGGSFGREHREVPTPSGPNPPPDTLAFWAWKAVVRSHPHLWRWAALLGHLMHSVLPTAGWLPGRNSTNTRPVARDHVQATVVGNQLVVVGGRDGGSASFLTTTRTEVCVYNFSTRKWRTLSVRLSAGRGGAGVATLANRYVVVSGGEVASGVVPTTEVLDMRTGRWLPQSAVGGSVTPRHGTQATTCGRGVYMAAGAATPGGSKELSTAEVLTLNGETPGTCG